MFSQPSHRAELGSRFSLFVRLLLATGLALLSLPLLSTASTADQAVCDYPVDDGDTTFGTYPAADPPHSDTTFEVDGNLEDCEFEDWQTVGTEVSDGLDDASNFQGSSKEFANPSTWKSGPSLTPADKADIDKIWVYNPDAGQGQHTFSYFGFSRGFTNGTTSYDVEYNQSPNTTNSPPRPNRSPGDLLVQLDQQGSPGYNFEITGAFVWRLESDALWNSTDCREVKESGYTPSASWCTLSNPDASFKGKVSIGDSPFVDGAFAEGGLDITNLFGNATCVGDFRAMNLRSRSSNSADSALKDWVSPQTVDIEGNCQDLVIEKRDANSGVNIAGATFSITPNPLPGTGAEDPITILVEDNLVDLTTSQVTAGYVPDEDTRDGFLKISQIEPGTYTVTETDAPSGYWMAPAPEADCPVIDAGDVVTVNCAQQEISTDTGRYIFVDQKMWLSPSITKTADGHYDSGYNWTIRKTVAADGVEPAEDDEATEDVDESGRASQTVAEGDSATFDYELTVTGTETKSNYQVTGNVTVVNPNEDDMVVTLSDAIENGDSDIDCSFDDDTDNGAYSPTVPPTDMGADSVVGTPYAYTCDLTNDEAVSENLGENNAWVEWDLNVYPQTAEQAWTDNAQPGTPATGNPSTASFAFAPRPANETKKTVIVTDEYNESDEFDGPQTVTYGEHAANFVDGKYVVLFPYSVTFDDMEAGTCTDYDNTAEVRLPAVEDSQSIVVDQGELQASDSATATVCVGSDLSVEKNAVLTFTRTYPFSIDKSVAVDAAEDKLPRVEVDPATGKATVPYEVVVTDGACDDVESVNLCDSGWLMTGTITVTNPNDFQDVTLETITDDYTGAYDECKVTIPAEVDALVIPAGDTMTYDYTCTFSGRPVYDGTNTAAVTWDEEVATTPTGADDFDFDLDPASENYDEIVQMTEVDKSVDVVDLLTTKDGLPIVDSSKDLGTVTWQSSGHEHTWDETGGDGAHAAFQYNRELEGTLGECVTYDNRASVVTIVVEGDPTEIDSDTASVQVCWQQDLSVSKDGAGTFFRRYDWDIEKSILVGPEGDQTEADAQTVNLDDPATAHDFEYRVKAIPLPLATNADSGWSVNGKITVTNPNSSAVADSTEVTITEVPHMGTGATCDVTDGEYQTADEATVTVSDNVVDLPADDSVTVNYSCSFSSAPHGTQDNLYEGNSNQAKITWDGGEETTDATPVEFTLPDENRTDFSVEVHDSQLTPTLLGTVEHDSQGGRTFEYSESHTGTAGACDTTPNTATIEHITPTSSLLAAAAESLASDTTNATVCVQKRLMIENAVTTSFDRSYKWVIDKVADKHNVEVSGKSTALFEYTVSVGPDLSVNGGSGYVDSGWTMTGTITVTNPNTDEIGGIAAQVSDLTNVGGGAECKVEGESVHGVTVPVGVDGVQLDYACTFTSKPAYTGTNTATVAWKLASGADTDSDAVASVAFENPNDTAAASPRETDRVIDVTDKFDGGAGAPVEGLQNLDWVTVKALPNSVKVVKYTRSLGATPGSCRTFPNIVTMFRDGTTTQVGLPADESVSVCSQVGPTLVNGASASYDRTYAWNIAKEADGTTYSTGNDDTAEVNYTVTATPGAATDSGWTMGGSVQVTNPNTYKSLSIGITVATTVGGDAACSLAAGQDMVVPASGSRTYSYGCSFTGQPAYSGTTTASVSWGGGTSGVDAPVAFVLDQETDRVIDVVDDQTVPEQEVELGTAEWNEAGTPVTFGYALDLAAEANECEEYTNTAAIVQTAQSADATVTVCGPEILPAEEVVPPAKPRPPVVKGVDTVIPSTGGPQLGLLWSGLGLLLTGAGLMAVRRRTRTGS